MDRIYYNFNRTFTSLAVSNGIGFKLLTLNPNKFTHKVYIGDEKNVYLIEHLPDSVWVTTVSRSTDTKYTLQMFRCVAPFDNLHKIQYERKVLNIKLSVYRAIVCFETEIYIYEITDMKIIQVLKIPRNPTGLCAFSSKSCLAYPVQSTRGEVKIRDTVHSDWSIVIAAHHSPLVALEFNQAGEEIATASKFSYPRYITHQLFIKFSTCSKYIITNLGFKTIYIFRLDTVHECKDLQNWIGNHCQSVACSLPTSFADMCVKTHFAYIKLKTCDHPTTFALIEINNKLWAFYCDPDGELSRYDLPLKAGEECKMFDRKFLMAAPVLPKTESETKSKDSSKSGSSPEIENPNE